MAARRLANTDFMVSTTLSPPFNAAAAATCDTLATFEVVCDCSFEAALMRSPGAWIHPTRQPVIA